MDSAAEPGFASTELDAAFAALAAAAERVAIELAEPHEAADVLRAERRLEHVHRIVAAAQVDNLARIEAERLHRIDGHRSVKAHVRHVLKVSPEEASRRAKISPTLRLPPAVGA